MLTREELKAVHNNIITIMENRVMQMTGCNRQTANLVANEVLDLDRDADKLLNEKVKGISELYSEDIDYIKLYIGSSNTSMYKIRNSLELVSLILKEEIK